MLFDTKNRVEEDLEKIRFANLSPEKQEIELADKEKRKKEISSIKYEKNDRLAMVIAALSIVVPYVLVFITGLGVAMGLLYMFLLK